LTVNIDKTKVVVFRNGGNIRDNEKWLYNGNFLEVVNECNYILLVNTGNFKDGFPLILGNFHYRKDKELYVYLFSIKEVLSFPLIPPLTDISKDKCPNDKNQFGI